MLGLLALSLMQLPTVDPSDTFSVFPEAYSGSTAVLCSWTNATGGVFYVYMVDDGAGSWYAAPTSYTSDVWSGDPQTDATFFKAAATQSTLNNYLDAPAQAVFDLVDASAYCSEFPGICPPEPPAEEDATAQLSQRVATSAVVMAMGCGMLLGFLAWFMLLKTKDLSSLLFR